MDLSVSFLFVRALLARFCFVAETKDVVVDLRSDVIKGIALTASEYFALDTLRDSVVEALRNGTEKPVHHAGGGSQRLG